MELDVYLIVSNGGFPFLLPTSDTAKNILAGLFFTARDAGKVAAESYLLNEDFTPRDGLVLELTWFFDILLFASFSI